MKNKIVKIQQFYKFEKMVWRYTLQQNLVLIRFMLSLEIFLRTDDDDARRTTDDGGHPCHGIRSLHEVTLVSTVTGNRYKKLTEKV